MIGGRLGLAAFVSWIVVACGTGGQANAGAGDGGTCPTVPLTADCAPCMASSCNTQSVAALGPNWASHEFTGGACSDLVACYCACGEDRGCVDDCDRNRISAGCHDALVQLDACTQAACKGSCSAANIPDAATD